MGGMVVVGGVLTGGVGLSNTVVGLVGVLIGLLHLGRCLGAGIVVGLSEGGIVVMGGNIVVKALGGKVDVMVRMCGNVAVGGIFGISVKVAVGGIVGVSGKVAVGCVVGSVWVVRLLWVVLSVGKDEFGVRMGGMVVVGGVLVGGGGFLESIDLYAKNWSKREQVELKYLSEWKDQLKELVTDHISN